MGQAISKDVSKPARRAKAPTGLAAAIRPTPTGPGSVAGAAQNQRSPSRPGTSQRGAEQSDVLVSAVISTYLLTHLHHVLQRAEYAAVQEGRQHLAANYAQLRKVLCLDARTMEDASASGHREVEPPCAA
jgi:hypothetical protein